MNHQTKSISIELSQLELSILYLHVLTQLKSYESKCEILIDKKFLIIEKILFAKFGIKISSIFGFQKKTPYFSDEHRKLVKELKEINSSIFQINFDSHHLFKVYSMLGSKTEYKANYLLNPTSLIISEKWQSLEDDFIRYGLQTDKTELQEIVSEMLKQL